MEMDDSSLNSDDTNDDDGYTRFSVDSAAQVKYDRLCDQSSAYELISKAELKSLSSDWAVENDDALPQGEDISSSRKSLRDTAMGQFTTMIANGFFDTASLAEAQQLPDFKPSHISKLENMAQDGELPPTAATVSCLELAFSRMNSVDLSDLSRLSASCIVEAATKILKQGEVKSIDLSHLRQLSEPDVTNILDAAIGVKVLYIMDMPYITLQFIYSLWNESNSYLQEIYHTELIARPFANRKKYTFSQLTDDLESSPFAIGQNSPIKPIIFARVVKRKEGEVKDRKLKNPRIADGITMDWPRFKPAKSLLGCYSANKMTQFIFPLRDTFLHPLKLVRSLVNFMALSENRKSYDENCAHSTGFTMAKSFAMAPAKAHGPCVKVGALPEMLFKTAGMVARIVTELWPLSNPTFKEGEWSIVLINEHQSPFHKRSNIRDAFRLAVITLKAKDKDDGFRILSIEEFLKDVMGEGSGAAADDVVAAMEYWKSTASSADKCEAAEVHQLLPVLERHLANLLDGNSEEVFKSIWD
ncbi:MAG: hypothetical protein Q9203_002514 [Teloschistes exilis]